MLAYEGMAGREALLSEAASCGAVVNGTTISFNSEKPELARSVLLKLEGLSEIRPLKQVCLRTKTNGLRPHPKIFFDEESNTVLVIAHWRASKKGETSYEIVPFSEIAFVRL